MGIWPQCHKVTYEPRMVVKGQGRFTKHGLQGISPVRLIFTNTLRKTAFYGVTGASTSIPLSLVHLYSCILV